MAARVGGVATADISRLRYRNTAVRCTLFNDSDSDKENVNAWWLAQNYRKGIAMT